VEMQDMVTIGKDNRPSGGPVMPSEAAP